MSEALVAGLLAGWGIAVPVGAVAAYLVALTARTNARIGAAAALGVASADGIYALVAVVGGVALAAPIAAIATPLHWLSVLVLIGLGVRIIWTGLRDHRSGTDLPAAGTTNRPGRAYLSLLGITLLNPVTVLYFAALVLGSTAADLGTSWVTGLVFVLGAFCASASWQLVLVAGGVALGRALTGRTGRLVTALISGALIIGFAVVLLLGG
ncbi:MAG TPA: LysE family transporter [Nakamurella multipartita]|nr:LysE family transporter [Nakamurella multipartita]